jgi:hypothetical protein
VLIQLSNVQVVLPASHASKGAGNQYERASEALAAARDAARRARPSRGGARGGAGAGAGAGTELRAAAPAAAPGRYPAERRAPRHAFYREALVINATAVAVGAPGAPELLASAAGFAGEQGAFLPPWMMAASEVEQLVGGSRLMLRRHGGEEQQPQQQSQQHGQQQQQHQAAPPVVDVSAPAAADAARQVSPDQAQQPQTRPQPQARGSPQQRRHAGRGAAAAEPGLLLVRPSGGGGGAGAGTGDEEQEEEEEGALRTSAQARPSPTKRLLAHAGAAVSKLLRRKRTVHVLAGDAPGPARTAAANVAVPSLGGGPPPPPSSSGQPPARAAAGGAAPAAPLSGGYGSAVAAGGDAQALVVFEGLELLAAEMQRCSSTLGGGGRGRGGDEAEPQLAAEDAARSRGQVRRLYWGRWGGAQPLRRCSTLRRSLIAGQLARSIGLRPHTSAKQPLRPTLCIPQPLPPRRPVSPPYP